MASNFDMSIASRFDDRRSERPLDARQVRTRQALATAFLELIEEKPFDDITVREITGQAKIGYATFFRNFESKQQLLEAVACKEIADLSVLMRPLLMENDTKRSCMALCRYVDQHRKLWHVLLTGGAAAIIRSLFIEMSEDWNKQRFDADISEPVHLVGRYRASATIDLLSWWLEQGSDYSAEQLAEFLDMLVIAPSTRFEAHWLKIPG